MKKLKKPKKSILKYKWFLTAALSVVLLLLGSLVYFSTLSVLTDSDNKRNDFAMADLKAEVVEPDWEDKVEFGPDDEIAKKVQIKNTGTQPIFIRVALLPTLQLPPDKDQDPDEDDPLVLPLPTTGSDALLQLGGTDEEWLDGHDGFYYYLKQLPVGKESEPVLETVTLVKDKIDPSLLAFYEDANLIIDVKVEAIGLTQWAYRDAFWQGATPTTSPLKEVDEKWQELTVVPDAADLAKKQEAKKK